MRDGPPSLSPAEVVDVLRATAVMLQGELPSLPAAALDWHPAADVWCLKETLGHLIEAEQRGFAGRIRTILNAHGTPEFAPWDAAAVAQARRDCASHLPELLRLFGEMRAESVALVVGLEEADLRRGGHHPRVGYLTIGNLLHEWIHHDRAHLQQMQALVQQFVWPHMGNAQRFSAP